MPASFPDSFSRPVQSAVASAGYRVARWAAAREVLGNRVAKQRIPGALGETLQRWGVAQAAVPAVTTFDLTFNAEAQRFWLRNGLAAEPLERALLHLPALRAFWRQELRQRHFDALRAMVPQTWLMDDAPVPPGAVIHALGISGWDQLGRLEARVPAVAKQGQFLTETIVSPGRINASYHRDDKRRVLLCSVEALP